MLNVTEVMQYVTYLLAAIGLMAFLVSAVTQVIKSWPGLDKLPTSAVVIVLSLVLCPCALVALMEWQKHPITWYELFACMIACLLYTSTFIRENFGESVLNAMGEGLLIAVGAGIGLMFGGPVGALVGDIIALILDGIRGGEWATKFWTAFGETLFNWSFTSSLFETAKGFFEKAFTSDNFLDFGANIIAGIASGLTAGVAALTEPIFDLFAWVVDGICEVFGIHSPAKNMEIYGTYILEGIIEGFRNTFSEWTEALDEWYTQHIEPWFTLNKWGELYETIKTSLKTKWNETVGQWDTDVSNWWDNHVTKWFKKETWVSAAGGIKEGLLESFNAAIDGIKRLWNEFANWLNEKLTFTIDPVTIMGQTVYEGGEISLGKICLLYTSNREEAVEVNPIVLMMLQNRFMMCWIDTDWQE